MNVWIRGKLGEQNLSIPFWRHAKVFRVQRNFFLRLTEVVFTNYVPAECDILEVSMLYYNILWFHETLKKVLYKKLHH